MTEALFDSQTHVDICRQNDAVMVGVFGSVARGETTPQSDRDVLVRFARPKRLPALVTLERKLATALGKPVDLVTEPALHPALRDTILRDLRHC